MERGAQKFGDKRVPSTVIYEEDTYVVQKTELLIDKTNVVENKRTEYWPSHLYLAKVNTDKLLMLENL